MVAFYTVQTDKEGFPVKYIDSETYCIKKLIGPFQDPGEASQEFKVQIGNNESYYLEPKQFQAKAAALARLRRERAKRGETIQG